MYLVPKLLSLLPPSPHILSVFIGLFLRNIQTLSYIHQQGKLVTLILQTEVEMKMLCRDIPINYERR